MTDFDGEGDDNLDGDECTDIFLGGSGNDTITGMGGQDKLMGGSGDDTIYGGSGDDKIRGGSDNDTIYGGEGEDIILGDAGDDTLTGGAGADTFAFNEGGGNDTITDFDTSEDQIDLSQFTTAITWEQLSAKITTVTDPDDPSTVTGLQIDLSDFGGGTITLEGITAVSELTADMFCLPDCDNPLDDIFVESSVTGDEERNIYFGDTGDETYTALGGDDIVFAEEGDDTIYGGEGKDLLVGGEGADTIYGGAGSDTIYGGEGDDTITGGTGNDTITGRTGADTFVFAAGDGSDTITDFEDGTDTIDLTAITSITGFSDLTITQEGDNTVINLGADVGVEIILEDFTPTDLDATDFDFSM